MNIPLIFILSILGLLVIIYISRKILYFKFQGFENDNSLNIVILILLLVTIITIAALVVSGKLTSKFKSITPLSGDEGEQGDRGNLGKDSVCGIGCNDDAAYNKVMNHITNVYNFWCKITGNKTIPSGRFIENEYIRMKVKEIAESQTFADLLQQDGAHKLDIRGQPLHGYEKCDINKNCGAYDYLFQKWTEWILIILKYKNGYLFLNSKNMTDNDFNTLLVKEDADVSNNLTENWIFDIIDPETNNDISMIDILNPQESPTDTKNFSKTDCYKFYSLNGVPDAIKVQKERKAKNIKNPDIDLLHSIKSPFEEIGEYDAWYWGANPLSEPKLVDVCKYNVKELQDSKQYKLKVKLTNDYDIIWESKNARQERIMYNFNNKTQLTYVPDNLKGDKEIVVYRPKQFIDNDEPDLRFKTYYPVGDVMTDANDIKTSNNQCYPRFLKSSYDEKGVNYSKNGSKKLTLLVSGDTVDPVRYDKLYQNKRTQGFFANQKGFTFWRPVPPDGYVSLGDIIDVSPLGQEPSLNTVKCIPKECVTQLSNNDVTTIYNTADTSMSYDGIKNKNLPESPNSSNEVIDTDKITDNITFISKINTDLPKDEGFNENDSNNIDKLRPYLSNYNIFRGNDINGDQIFYKIKEEYLYDDFNLDQTFEDKIIKKPKFSEKYSILKIYDD